MEISSGVWSSILKVSSDKICLSVFLINDLLSSNNNTLIILGISLKSLLPIPIPCFLIFRQLLLAEEILGCGLITDRINAPVGVTLSPEIPSSMTTRFLSSRAVAGEGIGIIQH